MKATSKKRAAVRFFYISFAIVLICSVFIWGFQSSWGDINIERLTLTDDDGNELSTLIYVPENATVDTPAPAVLIFHGRSNQAHSNDTWCMELARRGYVVLSPDLGGGGESVGADRARQAMLCTEYANSLAYVIQDEINLAGYSFGTQTCLDVYNAMPDIINSITEVFGPYRLMNAGGVDNIDTNIGLLKAICDQYDYWFIGEPDACAEVVTEMFHLDETVVPGKDYDWNGHLFRYMVCENTMHQTGNISGSTLTNLLSYITSVTDAPIQRDLNDQVWIPQQVFSGIACVAMMFLLAATINLLMQLDFFASAANARPQKPVRRGWKPWAADILFALVIPAILFIPVSLIGMRYSAAEYGISRIFTSTNLNGIMLWLLVAMCLIGIIRMVIAAQKRKKAGIAATMGTYALGGDNETRIDWSKPAKGLLLGLITISFFGVWLWIIEGFAGINYQVWNLSTYLRFSPERLIKAIPYIIIIFIVMFTGNMTQRYLPSTGNERKDTWIAVAVSTVMTASALFVLLVIQYGGNFIIGTGQTVLPQFDVYNNGGVPSAGALDFAFGYCYMMGGTTGVVTYLYRKYGNIWVGVIPCAIFAGVVTLSSFTLVH